MKNLIKIPEITVKRQLPKNFVIEDSKLFEAAFSYKNSERDILFLKNVYFLKNVIFDLKSFKFYDTYCFVLNRSRIKLLLTIKYIFNKGESIENGILITDNWSKEYFHWLTDALTRYVVSEKYCNQSVLLLPIKFNESNYIIESLDFLKIKYQFITKKKTFIHNLILPSHTANTGNYNVEAINKLNDKFVNKSTKPVKKVYVSRQQATRRKITNESELVQLLMNYNFEIHYFENYSFHKQLKLLNESKILVGLHGAGLTNMLFMPKGGIIVELRNQNDTTNNCYFSLASDLKHDYYYLKCQGDNNDTYSVNVTIDLNNFENILKTLNI